MSYQPFTLRIFLTDGNLNGLRVIERSHWIGKMLVFPRLLFPEIRKRSEFNQTGAYLLLGPRADGEGEMLYVGEGDPVRPRLESHFAQKDFRTARCSSSPGMDSCGLRKDRQGTRWRRSSSMYRSGLPTCRRTS